MRQTEENLLGTQPILPSDQSLQPSEEKAQQRPVGNFHSCFAFYILQNEVPILFINVHICAPP